MTEENGSGKEEKKINILYVDDEINNLQSFKAGFRRDYNVFTAISAEEGTRILEGNIIHIVVTDQRMPGVTGVEFLESILKEHPDPIRILLTGYTDIEAVVSAVNRGQIYYYLTKPWDEQQLRVIFKNGFEIYSLREENKELLVKLAQMNDQLEFLLRQKLLS